jgi:hypothetical protein
MSQETQEQVQEQTAPVFEEVANMTSEQAVNILVQAAQLAQRSGNLTVRDSVMLAKAINTVLPGSL